MAFDQDTIETLRILMGAEGEEKQQLYQRLFEEMERLGTEKVWEIVKQFMEDEGVEYAEPEQNRRAAAS